MPALALITPDQLRQILEADGFHLAHEDEFNWWMARGLKTIPINVPKEAGEDGCTSFAVMETTLSEAGIDHQKYFLLKEAVFGDKKKAVN